MFKVNNKDTRTTPMAGQPLQSGTTGWVGQSLQSGTATAAQDKKTKLM